MPFQTINTFTKGLHDAITKTTPISFGIMVRSNNRAAQGFEDEKSDKETNKKWSDYMSGTLDQNDPNSQKSDGSKQSHPDLKRFLYFWTWPYLVTRGIRAALMLCVDHLASNNNMGKQSESPPWAKGLKGVVASLLYPAEILSYIVGKIPDAIVGKVNNTRSRIGLIGAGSAIAAAVTACILFPPAIPIALMAAKLIIANSFVSAAFSGLYAIAAGVVKELSTHSKIGLIGAGLATAAAVTTCILFPPAIPVVLLAAKFTTATLAISAAISGLYTLGAKALNGIKKLFGKKETKKDSPIMANEPSPTKQKPDTAKIQRELNNNITVQLQTSKGAQFRQNKAARNDDEHTYVPVGHPVDNMKSILNNEEVSEVKFYLDQPVPAKKAEVLPPDNVVVQFHTDQSEAPKP